jgi:RNA polymerase subunit RPABC4/transcription elongation factor Spt4
MHDYGIYTFMILMGLILLLTYWLLAPVWVFLDARKRQNQPLPWAVLVLLTNIVGLIVYWIVQTQSVKVNPALVCPACGNAVHKNHLYCPWCAAPLVKACKNCGKTLEKEWVACPWCGTETLRDVQGSEHAAQSIDANTP